MLKLRIDNSVCKLEGLTPTQLKELKALLSYTADPQAAYFAQAYNTRRYLISQRGEFPTGLLYLVEGYLKRFKFAEADIRVQDVRKVPTQLLGANRFELKLPYTPYPEQIVAAVAAVNHCRGIITAPTGLGKSVIAALIVEALQVPTLIVVPSLELKRQLRADLKSSFGSLRNITVENVDALDPNEVDETHKCVIIDEFHHSGAKSYRALNKKAWKNIYYKLGLTATPFRSQDHERLLLESVLSRVIYKVDHAKAVELGRIVPIEAYYVDLPKRNVEGYTWAQVYKELVTDNDERNSIVASFLASLAAGGKSTLCLVKEIKHGEALADLTGVAFANGQEELTRQLILEFNLNERKGLIGTTGILGEGVDSRPCEYVIIAGLGRSKNAFMQQIGRGFRVYPGKESCKIIIFRDESHKFTLNHFKAQVKILKDEYGVRPVRLEL